MERDEVLGILILLLGEILSAMVWNHVGLNHV